MDFDHLGLSTWFFVNSCGSFICLCIIAWRILCSCSGAESQSFDVVSANMHLPPWWERVLTWSYLFLSSAKIDEKTWTNKISEKVEQLTKMQENMSTYFLNWFLIYVLIVMVNIPMEFLVGHFKIEFKHTCRYRRTWYCLFFTWLENLNRMNSHEFSD